MSVHSEEMIMTSS